MQGGNPPCLITGMEHDATSEQIINAAGGFWQQVELFISVMLLPSRLNQVGAVLLLMLVAHLLARALSP